MSQTLGVRHVLTGAILLIVAACASSESVESTSTTASSTTTTAAGTLQAPPTAPRVDLGGLPNWFTDEDAAPEDLIDVIASELEAEYLGSMAVEWPTGGLGCSDGGYDLQVITPGYVIFFEGTEGLLRVHTSEAGNWKECDLGRPLEGIPTVTS